MRLFLLLLVGLAGCITIPAPAGGDDDAEPETRTCDRSLGELLPSPAFDVEANVLDVVLADLDRDGLDEVIALFEPDRIAVASARAAGGFEAPVELTLDADLRALATVDLDDDGDLDVVAAGDAVVALGNDAGALAEATRVSMTCVVDVLATGQFDDDLRRDVAAGCSTTGALLLLRHGEAPLGESAAIGTFPGLRGMAAGEVAGDDRDDLIVVGSGVELLRAIGAGSFARTRLSDEAATAVATGDLDADGRDDAIAWVGGFLAWIQGGDTPGALVTLAIDDVGTPLWLELGGIDGNPGDDVVLVEGDDLAGSQWRTVVIASPLTEPSVEPQPGTSFRRCRLGRLDPAVDLDLACVNPYGPILVPVFHSGVAPEANRPGTTGAVLGQFDEDAALEVLTIGSSVEVLQPAGDRFVVEASSAGGLPYGEPIAAVEWTGDGRTDLLLRTWRETSSAIELFPATGEATFGEPIQVLDTIWPDLVVADLDDDGYPDLAGWTATPTGEPSLHVAFGGPGGTIAETRDQFASRPLGVADVVAGDAAELILQRGDQIQVVRADDRSLSVVAFIRTTAYGEKAVASDLDGDGDRDLVTLESTFSGFSTMLVRTYVQEDDGAFKRVSSEPIRGNTEDLAVGDLDGDGAPDVVAGALMLLRGQGDGRVAPPVPFARPSHILGTVPAPAGEADQLVYIVSSGYGVGSIEMLAPGCR